MHCVFAGANFFHLSLVSGQSLFNGIQNCNKSHLRSLRKKYFLLHKVWLCASSTLLSIFWSLLCYRLCISCCSLPTSALHKLPPPPTWLLSGKSQSQPSSREFPQWEALWAETATLARSHNHLNQHKVRPVTTDKSNSCKTSHGYSRKNQVYCVIPLPDTLSEHTYLCGGLLKIPYPSQQHCKAPFF